jgi:hypothetical protein
MLSRLIFGLALGLLMYMPRPRGPQSGPPGTLPPGVDGPPGADFPPGEDGPPEIELPTDPQIHRHFPHTPSVPPTPPPGYEGDWPPASERPDAPPTPPPGFEGEWPGSKPSLRERLIDLLRDLGFFDNVKKKAVLMDAKAGVQEVGGAAKAAASDDAVEA